MVDETRPEIELDPHDHSREYIPLPGGWEVQTKGAGSTYRLLDKKSGERHAILTGKDWKPLQAFFTRFAHELFQSWRAAALPATSDAKGWQPWATVPRDGDPVLATNGEVHDGFPQVIMFDEERISAGYPWCVADAEVYYPEGAFTHWRRDCLTTPEILASARG